MRLFMSTKKQRLLQLRAARCAQLELLREAERKADPNYVKNSAGFWLERWRGQRSVLLGTTKMPRTSSPAVSSAFCLST